MVHGILAQSYMDLPGAPMFLTITIRFLIVIFNPMGNFDFECFRKESSRKVNLGFYLPIYERTLSLIFRFFSENRLRPV
jgi:hypothetical protein